MSPAPASSGAGCGQSHRGGLAGSAEGMSRGHEHRAVSPSPCPERGDGEGSWGASWGLPDAVAQLKERDFLPKPGCKPVSHGEDGLEVLELRGTAPASGWVTGETSCTHPAMPLLSISHLKPEGDKPARAWDPAVTPPGQAATPTRLPRQPGQELFHAKKG